MLGFVLLSKDKGGEDVGIPDGSFLRNAIRALATTSSSEVGEHQTPVETPTEVPQPKEEEPDISGSETD